MIFRTGSVLMVGKCSELILNNIYIFIRDILEREYYNIYIENHGEDPIKNKNKQKKYKKKIVYLEQ